MTLLYCSGRYRLRGPSNGEKKTPGRKDSGGGTFRREVIIMPTDALQDLRHKETVLQAAKGWYIVPPLCCVSMP